jgi:hypothetical protein
MFSKHAPNVTESNKIGQLSQEAGNQPCGHPQAVHRHVHVKEGFTLGSKIFQNGLTRGRVPKSSLTM